jgi:hypothetical protein
VWFSVRNDTTGCTAAGVGAPGKIVPSRVRLLQHVIVTAMEPTALPSIDAGVFDNTRVTQCDTPRRFFTCVSMRRVDVITGRCLQLTVDHHARAIRVDLPINIRHGDRLAFAIPCGQRFTHLVDTAAFANATLGGRRSGPGRAWRSQTQQLAFMRALIALDAHLAGASYRQTAEAVFGTRTVRERWACDSTLKEQTRYLVRKACDLMNRGAKTV